MPNIKSAKKRVKTNAKKEIRNNDITSSMRTAIKKVEKEAKHGSKESVAEKLNVATKKIDKACSSGLIHKNKAAREKSRLTKQTNSLN